MWRPTLTGRLVLLRPLTPDDFDALYDVGRDPLIWEQHPERNRHELPVFQRYFDGALAADGGLAIVDRATGAIIGSSRYHGHDPARREIEIGWTFLARRYWGGRYNAEVKRLMLDHAFQYVDSVVFLVGPANVRSQRAMEKIGGVRAGMRPDGRGGESVVFEITRSAWAARWR